MEEEERLVTNERLKLLAKTASVLLPNEVYALMDAQLDNYARTLIRAALIASQTPVMTAENVDAIKHLP
jgi:hypothetical protein